MMGLDMYLYLEEYNSSHPYRGDDATGFYPPELKDFQEKQSQQGYLSKMTKYQVGYWRKANMVHRFFVEHCAEGEDDCRPVYVPLEALKELKNRCLDVLNNHDKAKGLLPTQEGFFFGGVEYDEYYFSDIQDTLDIINPVIDFLERKHDASWSCYYDASW